MRSFWATFGIFCLFSLLLLALVPLLSALMGTSMDFAALAGRASQETGIEWTSNLWDVARLAIAEPGLWLLVLGSSVPTLAAVATLAVARDREAWRDFASHLTLFGPRKQSARAMLAGYAVLLLSMIAGLIAVFELRSWLSPGEYVREPGFLSTGLIAVLLTSALLDQGAVLEEGGWRGFATPFLQRHGVTPLRVALLVGLVWGLWHVPRDVVAGVVERLGLVPYLFLFLPSFILGTVSTSILASYFMNRLGGSVIPAIMVHGLSNDALGISGFASIERALTPSHQITKAIPFCLLAIAIVAVSGGRLGLPAEEDAD